MSKETSQAQAARRIAGMLAQAEDAAKRGSEAERDIWLEKAAALQFKYAIDEATLASQGRATEGVIYEDFCQESNTPLIKAKRELISGLARLFRGKAIIMPKLKRDATGEPRFKNGKAQYDRRAFVRVYAYESDLAFIRMMYTSLILQMQTMMARDEDDERNISGLFGASGVKGWRVSYSHAWVSRVYERMETDKAFQERDARTTEPGTALVLRTREQGVLDRFNADNPRVKAARFKTGAESNAAGKAAGWVAGGRADLNGKKVASGNQGQIRG